MARKSSNGSVWRVVFYLALIVFVGALATLGYIVYSYVSADRNYDKIARTAFSAPEDLVSRGSGSTTDLADMAVDWDYLKSVNPDIVAWVYLPGTAINYPVCQAADNDKYLTMDFNQKDGFSARCGTIFLDCNNKADFSDQNNVLYGHHMNDGSMFACVSKDLTDMGFFNEHRTVYVLTPEMNYACQTFSLVITDGWDELVETNFADADSRVSYIKDKESRSIVLPSEGAPDPVNITKLFTFSTCDYTKDNGRAVLYSRVSAQAVPGSGVVDTSVSTEDISAVQDAQAAA